MNKNKEFKKDLDYFQRNQIKLQFLIAFLKIIKDYSKEEEYILTMLIEFILKKHNSKKMQ